MHILVAEDEKKLAALLRRALVEVRHTIDLAHDGPAGLDLALSDTYDLIILDLMLPGLDGIELCRQVRAQRIATPILMLTTESSAEKKQEGKAAGATAWIVKPFDPPKLLQAVDRLFLK